MRHVLIRTENVIWANKYSKIDQLYDVNEEYAFCKISDESYEKLKGANLSFKDVCDTGKGLSEYRSDNKSSWFKLIFLKIMMKLV